MEDNTFDQKSRIFDQRSPWLNETIVAMYQVICDRRIAFGRISLDTSQQVRQDIFIEKVVFICL